MNTVIYPVHSATPESHPDLSGPLARLRRRTRLYLALDGAIVLVTSLIIAGLAQLALDRWLRFSLDQRALLNSVITLLWLWIIYRELVRRLVAPLPDRVLAGWIDRAHPELHDRLRTAVELAEAHAPDSPARGQDSAVLVRRVLDEAANTVRRVPVIDVLNHRRARRQLFALLLLFGLIGGAWSVMTPTMNTWFLRNWLLQDLPWQQSTHIWPINFDEYRTRRIPRGDELEIRANVEGDMPADATVVWWTPGGRRGEEAMTIEGARRLFVSLGTLTENVEFRIMGGDERTAEYLVEAVEPPHVVRTVATITPPAYTDSPPVEIEQQTAFELLAGSTLELEVQLNKRVASAEFVNAAGQSTPWIISDRGPQRAADGTLQPAHSVARLRWPNPPSGAFRLELVDHDGYRDRGPVRFSLKIAPDQPPSARLEGIGIGELITPQAILSLRVAFEDPYGLASAALIVQQANAPEQPRPLPDFQTGLRRYENETRVDIAGLGCAPGDRLQLWSEARDLVPPEGNIGRSKPMELRVVTAEELLSNLARRELELRREFEQLLGEQRTCQDSYERVRADLAVVSPPPAALQRVAALTRQQSTHATRCLGIVARFEQILAEMRTNRVARTQEERRIGERVIAPLLELARESMPLAIATLAAAREQRSADAVDAASRAQAEVIRKMRAALANMLQWEGYREAVDLLRELIGEQGELRSDTLKELEGRLRDILELELEPAGPEPTPASRPGTPP